MGPVLGNLYLFMYSKVGSMGHTVNMYVWAPYLGTWTHTCTVLSQNAAKELLEKSYFLVFELFQAAEKSQINEKSV